MGFGQELLSGNPKFDDIVQQFKGSWSDSSTNCPEIDRIYCVRNDAKEPSHSAYCSQIGKVPVHGKGKGPGNQQRRFHATHLQCNFRGTPCSNSNCT
eukprot:3927649-Amphidinium_carterae.2